MFTALRRHMQLSPPLRALIRAKQVNGAFAPDDLITLLRPLAEFDGLNDRSRGKTGCLMGALFLALVIGIFIATAYDGWVLPVLVPLGVVLLVLLVLEFRLTTLDLSNNLRQIALPFLAVLREDMAPGTRAQVSLDLRDAVSLTKKVSTGAPYPRGVYQAVDSLYRDAWFSGTCRLADGSSLRWSVVDDVIESRRSKRNARGKQKTKLRFYKRSRLQAVVGLRHAQYRVQGDATTANTRMRTRSDPKWSTVKLVRKLKARDKEPFDVRELIDLVATAYRRVVPAPKGTPA